MSLITLLKKEYKKYTCVNGTLSDMDKEENKIKQTQRRHQNHGNYTEASCYYDFEVTCT